MFHLQQELSEANEVDVVVGVQHYLHEDDYAHEEDKVDNK